MIKALAKDLLHFLGPVNHVWYLAHVVNLVARAILHQFNISKGDNGEDSKDKSGAKDESTKASSDKEDEGNTDILAEVSDLDEDEGGEENEIENNDKERMNLAEVKETMGEKIKNMAKLS
jgi:hypothetical protein